MATAATENTSVNDPKGQSEAQSEARDQNPRKRKIWLLVVLMLVGKIWMEPKPGAQKAA